MFDATDGPQAVTLNQHCHSIQKHVPICRKGVKEWAFVSVKSMATSSAVITMLGMTIDFDVVSTYFPKIPTEFLVAPLSLSFHRASPRLGRCAHHTPKMGFPGLGVQHQNVRFRHKLISLEQYFTQSPGVPPRVRIRGGEEVTVLVSRARLSVDAHHKKRFVGALKYPDEMDYRSVVASDLSWRTLDIVQG